MGIGRKTKKAITKAKLRTLQTAEQRYVALQHQAARMSTFRSQERAERLDARFLDQAILSATSINRNSVAERSKSEDPCIQTVHSTQYLAFQKSISIFADIVCSACMKLCYKAQTCNLAITKQVYDVLPDELKHGDKITVCNRCANLMRKGRTPTQAYWNAMFLDDIPTALTCLTEIERRLLSRIIPFVKIIKLGGRFGQYGFRGRAVLFAQDVEEVAEQLPLAITNAGIAVVCEQLESVQRSRQFQVDVPKLWAALHWLILNNVLYRNVRVNYDNTNFDIMQICQVVENAQTDVQVVRSPSNDKGRSGFTEIVGDRAIVRGSFHQAHHKFQDCSRGKQCTANAAVAIAACAIKDLSTWTTDIVDAILLVGDRLYIESISRRNAPHEGEINREYLTVSELHNRFQLLSHDCTLTIGHDEDSICGHLHKDNTAVGFPNLINGLSRFFQDNQFGVLTCNAISLTVFRYEDSFWIFDSHSRGPKGRQAQNGTACLMRFPSVLSLFTLLKNNIPKSQDERFGDQYSITRVDAAVRSVQQNTMLPTEITETSSPCEQRAEVEQHVISKDDTDETLVTTSILRPIDESIPQVSTVIEGQPENGPVHNLKRKTVPPLQMYKEQRAEELAWYYLFPRGRNGLREVTREHEITPLDYCQARVMSADTRFQRNDYLFYALSVMEFYRARQNVGVCLRMRQGVTRPEGLVENIHLNMRGIRGSNAYWQTACSGLIAMVRNLGPPQWFLTLSCNDLNWNDILKALLISAGRPNDNPEHLQFEEKQRLVENYPVTLSRQFMVRVNAMMRVLKNDNRILGGKLQDFWWRIEFQNRGSPHLHMLCWNEGVPSFDTPEGVEVIDKIVSCSKDTNEVDLDELVARVQVHVHTATCYKDRADGQCRFGFPRNISEKTVLLGPDEALHNKGRFCILQRTESEKFVNNYNADILRIWRANMDIQPCGNVTAVAYYIAKYASKHEPHDVGQAVRDAVSRVRRYGGDVGKQLFAVSMAILNHRQVSASECAFRLCHLKLRDSSRKVIFVNTCRPEERYRMLRMDSDEGQVHVNIFDRYVQRPETLENLSLAEFAVSYEHVTRLDNNEEDGDIDVYGIEEHDIRPAYIKLRNGSTMKQRTRHAVLRTRYYTQTGDREGYFYSYLVAHVPFRNEQDLLEGFDNAENAFNAKRDQLRPLQEGGNVEQFQHIERELQQVIAQIAALENNEPHNNERLVAEPHDQVEAMVDGYDPGLVDIDIRDDGLDGEEMDNTISDEEFHHCITSMNIEQRHLFDTITDTM